MHSVSKLLPLALASTVVAHTRMYSVWVNGEDQGDGRSTYIRSPSTNNPVKDVTSADREYFPHPANALNHQEPGASQPRTRLRIQCLHTANIASDSHLQH